MKKILPILFAIVIAIGCFLYAEPTQPQTAPENVLQVHFLDVGQADCALVIFEEDAMLIDAGNNDDADTILDYLDAYGVQQLKYVVGTHPHEDHIGALDAVLYAVGVKNLLMPQVSTNTASFEDVLDAAIAKSLTISAPHAGDTFYLGKAKITAVNNYSKGDLNNASIMLHLTYGDTSFLFTGDAETDAEIAAIQTGLLLDCDILKAGHHGSSTSSSPEFLAATTPSYVVISCGKNNDYGHPHKETLKAFESNSSIICRTDTMGTLLATCDGTTTYWNNSSIPTLKKEPPVAQSPIEQVPIELSPAATTYILNTNTMKFHYPSCRSVPKISVKNREDSTADRNSLISAGYSPCGNCRP